MEAKLKISELKITEKIICFFCGHIYTRFERRKQPTCVSCGSRRERYKDRRAIISEDIGLHIHSEHLQPALLGNTCGVRS